MILGGSRWSEKAWAATQRFAERFDLPVCTTFRRGHLFDQTASMLRRRSRHRAESEAAGARQGRRPRDPGRRRAWAKCRARATRCSTFRRRGRPSCMCIRAPRNSAASIARIWRSTRRRPPSRPRSKACRRRTRFRGASETSTAHADYLAFTDKATEVPGAVNLGEIMVWLREQSVARRHPLQRRRQFLRLAASLLPLRGNSTRFVGPTSGSMGYGVPAAVAMKRLYPERNVFCLAGDGDFLMNGQEFMTAVQYDLPIVIVDRRQRHVRHHPHASGARISRPRGRRPR